ncbi:MAG: hypothetical protein RID09_29620 [Coleofasciculus sp. G1-WW12-02]
MPSAVAKLIAFPPKTSQTPNPKAFQVLSKVAIAFPTPDCTISENKNLRSHSCTMD